jgi:ankyrin repeat protein
MNKRVKLGALACALVLGHATGGTAAEAVDFARDVQPLLRQHCIECHGAEKQQGGFRLDRRSSAHSGALRRVIAPGSSAGSVLYQRITGVGAPMPPEEPLAPEEVETLRRWIDEGATWPDALANEAGSPTPPAAAVRLGELIRLGERDAVLAEIRKEPAIVNLRGARGTTPLMQAALYGDASLLAAMLEAGGDPNLRNDAGATALMWAIEDAQKVRLLLEHGADANVASVYGRTPLLLATGLGRPAEVVQLLLKSGATAVLPALAGAVLRGNADVVHALLAAGVQDNGLAASLALRFGCGACLEALSEKRSIPALPRALLDAVPPAGPGDPQAIFAALARGADAGARDPLNRTVLSRAAISETITPAAIQALIDGGADVNVRDRDGATALDYARRAGRQEIIEVLVRAGAVTGSPAPTVASAPLVAGRNDVRAAVARSVPLLQRSGIDFYNRGGCVSCHHNLLTTMTVATARARGLRVDEGAARRELAMLADTMEAGSDATLQGASVPGNGGATTTGYLLLALAAAGYSPDARTDELVRYLRLTQLPGGHWRSAIRPPSESGEITATAVSLRGLHLYGRAGNKAEQEAIVAAKSWLEDSVPQNTEDRVFRLLGLRWADAPSSLVESARSDLLATQAADGGWGQVHWLGSDAYATGSALVALAQAGLDTGSAPYRRGVEYLLKTQLADGSWRVTTRAHRTQFHFESGFPHGMDQFISAAGTNWATQALVLAIPAR